jgi:hypothetical protein
MTWLLALAPLVVAAVIILRGQRRRGAQIRFIREKLATAPVSSSDGRVIAAMSTLPDRTMNLQPTIRCLLPNTLSNYHASASCDVTRIGDRRPSSFL